MKERKTTAETSEQPETGEAPREETAAAESGTSSASTAEATPEETREYVLTVSAATGEIRRIEKVEGGTRTELSPEEYATVFATATGAVSYNDASAAAASVGLDSYYRGYAQAVFDYQSALATQAQSEQAAYAQATAEQAMANQNAYQASLGAAYAQGVTDYKAAIDSTAAQNEWQASLQAAYAQGISDCQTAVAQSTGMEAQARAAYYQGMQAAAAQAAAAAAAQNPLEAAYYQGLADYRTSLGQASGTPAAA